MLAFYGNRARPKHQRRLSPEFQHALNREVLKTESVNPHQPAGDCKKPKTSEKQHKAVRLIAG
jgi:hypothetical protein